MRQSQKESEAGVIESFVQVLRVAGEPLGLPVPRESPDFEVNRTDATLRIGIELTELVDSDVMLALNGHFGFVNYLNRRLQSDATLESDLTEKYPGFWMRLHTRAPVPKSRFRLLADRVFCWVRTAAPGLSDVFPDAREISEWVEKGELCKAYLPRFRFESRVLAGRHDPPDLAALLSKKLEIASSYANPGELWLVVYDARASAWATWSALSPEVVSIARQVVDGPFSRLYLFDTAEDRAWRFDACGRWSATPPDDT